MNANFACPFCQSMLQMDASHAGAQVRCPACGNAFQLGELPPQEPEIPTATLVQPRSTPSHSAAAPQQRPPAQPQAQRPTGRPPQQPHSPHTGQPQHRPAGAPGPARHATMHRPTADETAKEERKAQLMLGGVVVGAIAAIGLLVHFGIAYLDKERGEASGLKELAQMDAAREKTALQEERAAQAKADAAKEVERKKIRDQLSLELCGGDDAVADALLTALEQVHEETMEAFNSGQLPSDLPAFMEDKFMRKLAENAVLRKWVGARSPREFAKAFFGSMEQKAPAMERGAGPAIFATNKYGSMGTGFFISGDGWLVTNNHVVKNVSEVEIRTATGEMLPARVMKTDPKNDLALLKTANTAPEWLPFSSGNATLGSSVFTVGYPRPTLQGVEPKFTDGTVSSLKGALDDATCYQISVPVQPGNSGGALVHLQSGWVIGVIRSQLDPTVAQNVNYAIKSTTVRTLLEATPAAKFILNIPAPANPTDASATIEKVKAATVLVLIPR